MGSVRIGRVNDELMKTLSELIRTVRDPRVDGLVSIVRVETAPDLGSAKVYISAFGDEKRAKECIKGLKSASGYLRRETAKRMHLRHTPELLFVSDDSIVSGTNIMALIDDVSKKDSKKRELDIQGAAEFLSTRDDVLIITHRSPDGDTVGSAAALAGIMKALGKNVCIFENPEFTSKLSKRVRAYYPHDGFVPK